MTDLQARVDKLKREVETYACMNGQIVPTHDQFGELVRIVADLVHERREAARE